ncbi:MAG: HNH endonuclease domain-containing protein [Emergencia sp.]
MTRSAGFYLPQRGGLQIARLSRLFDNMSESYKLFWFQAIVSGVCSGKTEFTYEELIDEMIADGWYMVCEYRLNLGPSDTLENLIHWVQGKSGLRPAAGRGEILAFLRSSDDREIRAKKRTLTRNVPYRLQAPFLENLKGKGWNVPEKELAAEINGADERLLYYFTEVNGLQSRIRIGPRWQEYILENQEILRGWIQFNMISYLQRRNPDVPGIISKLKPPQERNLIKVRKLWTAVAEICPLRDIYAREPLDPEDMSIDHFVPWSYVAHDELWNLSPTTRRVNSSKSSSLPVWDVYFPRLEKLEYQCCQAVWEHEKIRGLFESCSRDHVSSTEARMKLYQKGLSEEAFSRGLEEILLPVYQSARNMGFGEWNYEG